MRLLIATQAVDQDDPVLGFFHGWIEELARRFDSIEAVCLKEGCHALPANVRIHSLGKEHEEVSGQWSVVRKCRYAGRFLRLAWRLRRDYDAVFVHMNQEYVLLAGLFWRLAGKRVFLWRNHYAGSLATRLAGLLSHRVFYTSRYSYTATFANACQMPVGVDTGRFFPDPGVSRTPRSVLFLARMSKAKRPDMLVEALVALRERDVEFAATFVGSPPPEDCAYYESLAKRIEEVGLAGRVTFLPAVPNGETPALYRLHEIFVNCSPSGMLDKTIFEAAACGCQVLAASRDFAVVAGETAYFDSAALLADRLEVGVASSRPLLVPAFVERNSLSVLVDRLIAEMESR